MLCTESCFERENFWDSEMACYLDSDECIWNFVEAKWHLLCFINYSPINVYHILNYPGKVSF